MQLVTNDFNKQFSINQSNAKKRQRIDTQSLTTWHEHNYFLPWPLESKQLNTFTNWKIFWNFKKKHYFKAKESASSKPVLAHSIGAGHKRSQQIILNQSRHCKETSMNWHMITDNINTNTYALAPCSNSTHWRQTENDDTSRVLQIKEVTLLANQCPKKVNPPNQRWQNRQRGHRPGTRKCGIANWIKHSPVWLSTTDNTWCPWLWMSSVKNNEN